PAAGAGSPRSGRGHRPRTPGSTPSPTGRTRLWYWPARRGIPARTRRAPGGELPAPRRVTDTTPWSARTGRRRRTSSPAHLGRRPPDAPGEDRVVRVDHVVHEIVSFSFTGSLERSPRRCDSTLWAVSFAWRTQSAIPTPPYADPVTNKPGAPASASSILPTRSRWPTSY